MKTPDRTEAVVAACHLENAALDTAGVHDTRQSCTRDAKLAAGFDAGMAIAITQRKRAVRRSGATAGSSRSKRRLLSANVQPGPA
jgi:hypothetical protein